jgi:hypothetical protein
VTNRFLLMLILAAVASSCEEGGGENESHPPPEGVTTGFIGSCDYNVDCCAQCEEFYGNNPSDEFTGLFDSARCGDFKTQCSLEARLNFVLCPA